MLHANDSITGASCELGITQWVPTFAHCAYGNDQWFVKCYHASGNTTVRFVSDSRNFVVASTTDEGIKEKHENNESLDTALEKAQNEFWA